MPFGEAPYYWTTHNNVVQRSRVDYYCLSMTVSTVNEGCYLYSVLQHAARPCTCAWQTIRPLT